MAPEARGAVWLPGPQEILKGPRDVLCPPSLLCCILWDGGGGCSLHDVEGWVTSPACRSSPRENFQEAFPTCQPFFTLPTCPFSLASQAKSPGAFQVPCQPQRDPSPGDALQCGGHRVGWASPLPPCVMGFAVCFVWVSLFLSLWWLQLPCAGVCRRDCVPSLVQRIRFPSQAHLMSRWDRWASGPS